MVVLLLPRHVRGALGKLMTSYSSTRSVSLYKKHKKGRRHLFLHPTADIKAAIFDCGTFCRTPQYTNVSVMVVGNMRAEELKCSGVCLEGATYIYICTYKQSA